MKIDGHKLKLRHWLAMALILAVAAVACLSCFSCRYDGNTEMGPYVQAPVAVVDDQPVDRSWYMNDHGRSYPIWIRLEDIADANEARAIIDACQKDLQRRIDNLHKRGAEFKDILKDIPLIDPNEYASMKARLQNINTSLRYVGIEDFKGREDEAVEWFRDMWGAITDNWDTRSKDAVPIEIIWPDGCKTRAVFPVDPKRRAKP